MTNARTWTPADLVKGAKVTIEAEVQSGPNGHFEVKIGRLTYMLHEDSGCMDAILSVTPPPTDWSKMVGKQVNLKDCVGPFTLIAAAKIWGVVETPNGNEVAVLVSDLTPLPDEPSARETNEQDKAIADAMAFGTGVLHDGKHVKPDEYAKFDDSPAWQRAKVGDEVSVRAKVIDAVSSVTGRTRLHLAVDDEELCPPNTDILDIVEKAK